MTLQQFLRHVGSPHLGCVRQIAAAAGAPAGLVPRPLVRVGHLRQRRPRMPRLPARLAAALAAQRLGRGLGERGIRRRRLRRVPAVETQPPFQLRVLGSQRRILGLQRIQPCSQTGDLRLQRRDQLPKLRVLRGQLLAGRTWIGRHHTMIRSRRRRSTRHAHQATETSQITSVTREPRIPDQLPQFNAQNALASAIMARRSATRKATVNLGAKSFPFTLAKLAENFSPGPLRCADLRRSQQLRRERQEKCRGDDDDIRRKCSDTQTPDAKAVHRRGSKAIEEHLRRSSEMPFIRRPEFTHRKVLNRQKSVENTPNIPVK